MSFLDGIVNAARTVLGLPPGHDEQPRHAQPHAPKERGDRAVATPTSFEPSAHTDRASSPSLAERLQGDAGSGQARLRPTGGLRSSSGLRSVPAPAPHETASHSQQPPASVGQVASGARAIVQDATTRGTYGTVDTLGTSGSEAAVAAESVQSGLDYYARTFGRDGVDGAGSSVNVLIDDRTTDSTGAQIHKGNGGYYRDNATGEEAIHFGEGERYAADRGTVDQLALYHATDLTIHELTHGIIRKETGQLGGEADEAGATNEGIADVMAASATRDWRLGEGMFAADSDYRSMRNIAQPDDPTAIHGLWTSVSEVQSNTAAGAEPEEHWASGVVSTAAYRVQQRLGGDGGWQAVERVFYDSIDNDRLGDMSFAAVGAGLRQSAAAVYGADSAVAQAFDQELRRGGL